MEETERYCATAICDEIIKMPWAEIEDSQRFRPQAHFFRFSVAHEVNKMAATRTFSFYRELNNLSTADFLNGQKMQKSSGKGPFYDVERVISKRSRKGKVSCFDLSDLSHC